MGALVLGHQPTRPRVRAVVEQQAVEVLVGFVVVLAVFGQLVVEVEGGIGLLLAEQLVERLLLAAVRAGPDNGRPALRRRDAPVEGIVPRLTRLSRQGVGRLLGRVVVEISGFVACLVRHRLLLFGLRDEFALVVSSYHAAAPPVRGGIWFAGFVALPVNSGYGAASGSYGRYGRMDVTGQRDRRAARDPGRGLDQVVRRGAGAARYRPVGAARDGARRARSQRRGEDHGSADPDHAAASRRRAGAGRGLRRGARRGRSPPVHRAGRPVGRHPGGAH